MTHVISKATSIESKLISHSRFYARITFLKKCNRIYVDAKNLPEFLINFTQEFRQHPDIVNLKVDPDRDIQMIPLLYKTTQEEFLDLRILITNINGVDAFRKLIKNFNSKHWFVINYCSLNVLRDCDTILSELEKYADRGNLDVIESGIAIV